MRSALSSSSSLMMVPLLLPALFYLNPTLIIVIIVRLANLNEHLTDINSKLDNHQASISSNMNTLKEDILRLHKIMDDEREKRDGISKVQEEEMQNLDKRLQEAIEKEQESRREAENELITKLKDKTDKIRCEFDKHIEDDESREVSTLRKYIEVDLPKLEDTLREGDLSKENMERELLGEANDEIKRLEEALNRERAQREETEEAMLRMMEDVVAKMQSEMAEERRNREATEESLLKLLEETCNKLNDAAREVTTVVTDDDNNYY
ncbi:hypothetical protein FOZ61_009161 [Perkinsus olseni]|uniref:Uncharacterized protein n=1 Tax=Perkinsus olseni TaxID=32597 RepID=A0A7J6L304_PEROL|nr:hypothetical protein FOZ61_009161 [Perkinsus olseni]